MSLEVSTILAELYQDHRNMKILLNILDAQAERLYDELPPDYELLHDIMNYMTVYPDAVHHRREDCLYAELRKVRPELTAGFQRIEGDHRDIGEAGRRIRDTLAAVQSGHSVGRKSLIADVLRYSRDLRSHMHWEEVDLFRRCRKMAEEGHSVIEHAGVEGASDPLFGPDVDVAWRRLLACIAHESGVHRLALRPAGGAAKPGT